MPPTEPQTRHGQRAPRDGQRPRPHPARRAHLIVQAHEAQGIADTLHFVPGTRAEQHGREGHRDAAAATSGDHLHGPWPQCPSPPTGPARGASAGRARPAHLTICLGLTRYRWPQGTPSCSRRTTETIFREALLLTLEQPSACRQRVTGARAGSRPAGPGSAAGPPRPSTSAPPLHPCSQTGQLHGWSLTHRRSLGTRRSCCLQGSLGTRGHFQLGPAAGRVAHKTPAAPPAGPPCLLECRSPSPGGYLGRGVRAEVGADASSLDPLPAIPDATSSALRGGGGRACLLPSATSQEKSTGYPAGSASPTPLREPDPLAGAGLHIQVRHSRHLGLSHSFPRPSSPSPHLLPSVHRLLPHSLPSPATLARVPPSCQDSHPLYPHPSAHLAKPNPGEPN